MDDDECAALVARELTAENRGAALARKEFQKEIATQADSIARLREALFQEIPANASDGTIIPDLIWRHCRGCGHDVNRESHTPGCWVDIVLIATAPGTATGEG